MSSNALAIDLDLCRIVGESADRLVSSQIFMSGGSAELTTRNITKELYEAARGTGEPLCSEAAAALLARLKPRDVVLICTGFFDPPSMIAEADGPIGAVTLARSLCVAFDVTPVFLTEVAHLPRLKALAESVGLEVRPPEVARTTPFKAALAPLPIDPERARSTSAELFDQLRPAAMISIEKPAPSPANRYHTGIGLDVTDLVGKVDYYTAEAQRRGVLTIGIGDGGNEVGMGRILDAVREIVPTGPKIGAALGADILVVATIANWGCYAIEACLAAALYMPEAIHAVSDERRVLDAAARCGLIDPSAGVANGWVDGTPPACSESILTLLREMVKLRLSRKRVQALSNFPRRWVERDNVAETLKLWAGVLAKEEEAYFAAGPA